MLRHAPLAYAYALEEREPVMGYTARLAALNGRSMRNFLQDMTIDLHALRRADPTSLQAIATIGATEMGRLARYTPRRVSRNLTLLGADAVGQVFLDPERFRFCPRCVREDLQRHDGPLRSRPWLRVEWAIPHFHSCHEHQTALATIKAVRPAFAPFDFVDTIDAIIPAIDHWSRATVDIGHSPFQAWARDRIDGVRDDANWLDDLPLHVGAKFCEALGLSAEFSPRTKPWNLGEIELARAAERGFAAASAGPEAIGDLLRGLRDARFQTRGHWSFRHTFGHAYELLEKTVDDPVYAKLRAVVTEFVIGSIPIKPGTDVLGTTVSERQVHSIRTASKASGAHAKTIRAMFERKGLATDRRASGVPDHRVITGSAEVRRLVERLKTAISGPEVERRLGLPRLHLDLLVAHGHLSAIGDTAARPNAQRRFTPEDVETFRDCLLAGAIEVVTPAGRQMDVLGIRRAATIGIGELVDLVLAGRFAWKGRLKGRDDYLSLLLDAEEVTDIVRSSWPPKTNLNKREIEAFIPGTTWQSVNALIAHGYLSEIEEFNPIARRITPMVSRDSAEAFRDRYITLGELCRTIGLHHKRVTKLLVSADVRPLSTPDVLRAFVYERDSALPVLHAASRLQHEVTRTARPALSGRK